MQHSSLGAGRWQQFSLMEQMGNIGSEISRAMRAEEKDKASFDAAVFRALELFDLTLDDPRRRHRLREIARAREVFCSLVFGENEYHSSLKDLNSYFDQFAYAARYTG